ncbi:MAG TPA: hypothetical protein VGK42_10405 [Candidatus Dormibacteraeota bacterium]
MLGVILAIASLTLKSPWFGPYATTVVAPLNAKFTPAPGKTPDVERFNRSKISERLTFDAPFGPVGRISPMAAVDGLLSNGAGLVLLALGGLAVFPRRARIAVQRLEDQRGVVIAVAAGIATILLAVAVAALLRFTIIFLAVIPAVALVAILASMFGIACVALWLGRLLERRLPLGPAHPLVVALAGALVVFDLALIPYVGVVALALVAITGLGLAIVTRFGSENGWSFTDLTW